MKRLLLFLFVPAVVVALVAAFALTSDTIYSSGPSVQREYLALGDSLGTGHPYDEPGPEYDPSKGYVPLFRDFLESEDALDTDLFLNNLSIDGATSTSLIYGVLPPQPPQLPPALAELEARNGDKKGNNDVKVVTVDIGGNDLLAILWSGICPGVVTPDCKAAIDSTFATFSANFDYTLGELRAAAGPGTTIIVMTYYNSLVGEGCPYSALAPLGEIVLEGNAAIGPGVNDLIRSIAAAHHAKVAELVPGGEFPALLGPTNILPDCVHANASGYQIIADAFADAYEN